MRATALSKTQRLITIRKEDDVLPLKNQALCKSNQFPSGIVFSNSINIFQQHPNYFMVMMVSYNFLYFMSTGNLAYYYLCIKGLRYLIGVNGSQGSTGMGRLADLPCSATTLCQLRDLRFFNYGTCVSFSVFMNDLKFH